MENLKEYDNMITSLTEDVNAYIDHKISWEIEGTQIEQLHHDLFCKTITDIKYKLLTKLTLKL